MRELIAECSPQFAALYHQMVLVDTKLQQRQEQRQRHARRPETAQQDGGGVRDRDCHTVGGGEKGGLMALVTDGQ